MGAYVLTDAFAYVGGYDFTGDSNELAVDVNHTVNRADVFGSDWAKNMIGVTSVDWRLAGFWNVAENEQDSEEWGNLGTKDRVVTFGPGTSTVGSPAYMFRALTTQYTAGGTHGDIASYGVTAAGSNGQGVVRGRLAVVKGDVNSTGAIGTEQQLGVVAAGEFLYATLHVFSAGTTITVVLESDDSDSFPSATTRATLGPITTAGGTWATRVAGAIADDDYFRFRVTACTGTFSLAGAIGVQ